MKEREGKAFTENQRKIGARSRAYQIEPASCKKSWNFRECFKKCDSLGHILKRVAEIKFDGIRYLWQIRPHGSDHNFLTSRRVSVKTGEYVEKQDKVPKMKNYPSYLPKDTIFDGEIICDGISSDTQHAMVTGDVEYRIWDILMLDGHDLREMPLRQRFKLLENQRAYLPKFCKIVIQRTGIRGVLEDVQDNGGEGIIVKDLDAPYGKGWTKVKDEKHADVIIWGYEKTKSKAWAEKDWIGALLIGQWSTKPYLYRGIVKTLKYDPNEVPKVGMVRKLKGKYYTFVDVGRASGFNFKVRQALSRNQGKNLGRVIEIEYQVRLKSGKFRHPRFNRFRDDKNPWECVCLK